MENNQQNVSTNVCAFFDVDQTIWSEKSVISFWLFYLQHTYPDCYPEKIKEFNNVAADLIAKNTSRETLNAWFYDTCFSNKDLHEIQHIAQQWCDQYFTRENFWNTEVIEKILLHKSLGHLIVLVSGSFAEILKPLAERVGATDVLCAPLEIKDNRFTGKMLAKPMIGYGKAKAVLDYIMRKNICAENSFGYGDDVSDLPFISILGNPTLVIRDEAQEMKTLSSIVHYQTILLGPS